MGQHVILDRIRDKDKANNQIVNNYPKYITDTNTSYFMGLEVK